MSDGCMASVMRVQEKVCNKTVTWLGSKCKGYCSGVRFEEKTIELKARNLDLVGASPQQGRQKVPCTCTAAGLNVLLERPKEFSSAMCAQEKTAELFPSAGFQGTVWKPEEQRAGGDSVERWCGETYRLRGLVLFIHGS